MRLLHLLIAASFSIAGLGQAAAQSTDLMLNECSNVAHNYFRDFTARTDMRYNGQRVDGTHAINGRIFLETRFEDFACSYERGGQSMVEFFAEGRIQNAYLPGGGSVREGSVVQVIGLRGGDMLNVRSGPGTDYEIVEVLPNGTSVLNLGCQIQGHTRWCRIEMMTDLRERGWVAGRYLTLVGSAAPPASGPLVMVTGVAANDVLNMRAGPGTNHRIVGALGNGSQVRSLGCESHSGSRWCQIEMLTDMRERGWVNARYLTETGTASQLPSPPPQGQAAGDTTTERIRFSAGSTGTELSGAIPPGGSKRYILSARNGQNLYVRVAHRSGPRTEFQIFNPDGTFLLERILTDREYRGQLWQSGDHVIEVINRRGNTAEYSIIIGID